jgi:alpha/beta superfamily hydrolase
MGELPPAPQTPGVPAQPGEQLRAATILPARRTPVTLHTVDGLRLQAEFALPPDRDPVATLVCCHPLPTEGGSLDSHVYRKAAWRLPALAGLAVLRFNTRGTAGSEGSFDDGEGERYDLAAALEYAEFSDLPAIWLVGWSFGSELVLRYGWQDPSVVGAVLLSPPLKRAGNDDLDAWGASGKPLLALVPEHDDYLRPTEAVERFARVPQAEVVGVEGAKHLWVGEKYVRRALDEVVRFVVPEAPLPTAWP